MEVYMYIVDEKDKKLVNHLKELLIKGDLESIISIRQEFNWSRRYLGEIIQDFINENSKIEEEPIEINEDTPDSSNKETKQETTPKVKKVKEKKVKEYIPSTSLDLTDKKIAVVVGDEFRSEYILPMIESLGGKGIMVDAFKRVADESYMTSALDGVDAVVIIKNYQIHATSLLVKTVCSKRNIPMAVSNSADLSSIERSIWRAVNWKSAEETLYWGSYT
jgi:hypothetical protein